MAKKENQRQQKQRYFPMRDCDNPRKITLIPISEEVYRGIYPEIWRVQKQARSHGQCICPTKLLWKCDGHCGLCQYATPGKFCSLDEPMDTHDGERVPLLDIIPDDNALGTDELATNKVIFEQLLKSANELMSQSTLIGTLKLNGANEEAIADKIGMPRNTMRDKIKRVKKILMKEFSEIKY